MRAAWLRATRGGGWKQTNKRAQKQEISKSREKKKEKITSSSSSSSKFLCASIPTANGARGEDKPKVETAV